MEINKLKSDINNCDICGEKSNHGVHHFEGQVVKNQYYCEKHFLSEVRYRGRKSKSHRNIQKK